MLQFHTLLVVATALFGADLQSSGVEVTLENGKKAPNKAVATTTLPKIILNINSPCFKIVWSLILSKTFKNDNYQGLK